ncbi:dynein heavy chain 5, axonemal-like isoform X1 [Cyanistes caeruleus]|uniref:dynein heavy chain 5, axonemal-like isoform X1 n=2 Tax=Cyanistes caeruleus TaxID=156563 RepID=UPI000CDA3B24|nr:dynein heavy chain 5, axonemal-like isoform X1 [Cyanistes caeruleus]XP_023777495.1 dynein heavy chain 5, axonemal-like isoform X1 [Cyanistes caeruleus]
MEETLGGETELGGPDEPSSSHGHSAQEESEQLRATQLSSKPQIDLSPPLIAIKKETESKYHRHGESLKTRGTELGSAVTGSSLTTVLPSAVKKSIVLSSESRKELAKQAKVTKEERRAQIDGRHRYLISRLADGIDLSEQQVEETIISDDKFELIGQFFAPSGLKKLIFFYQDVLQQKSSASLRPDGSTNNLPQKKLFITMGSTEDFTGTCAFFLRTSDEVITASNVSQEVNFGMFDCTNGNILWGLEFFLSQIMIPALKSQQNWGAVKEGLKNSQIQEFLYAVDKFVSTLSSNRQNIEDKIQLTKVDIDIYVRNLQNPSDYITAGTNTEVTEKLEEVVMIWTKQIRQVLVESEQIRREADDVGPSAELEHWKSRMSSFNSLLDEIKSSRVKKIISILQAARSKTLKQWKELDGSITIAANEAKDNVRYLYALDKFFGPLASASPVTVMEHIPSLMNTVCMIYCTSPYFNTSERMTSLFLKITNQIIKTCKTYLCEGVSKIWDLDRQELLKRIQQCIFLKEKYQASFQKIREELKESDRQFDISENYIFGKFETFCKRLEKIADMSNTMESLLELQRIKIEGIDEITTQYQSIATNTKSKQYDVLDYRKKEFEKDYLEFKNQIAVLYESIQEFVDSWFEKTLTTEQMLEFLIKLEQIGENIDLNEKYTIVLQQYSQDLEFIQKLYQKEKENPPLPRNIPPVAGKIMWAQQLFRKIDHPMVFLKKKTTLLKTMEMKKVIKNYNKMAAVLLEFELIYYRAWCRFAYQARNALCASLLVRHPETKELFVNLDPMVLEVFNESKYLRKMHFEVPDVVLGLCADEEQIKRHQRELQNLLISYKEHLNRIPVVLKPLMKPLIGQVEDALTPGLMQLSWTSLNINKFIQNVYSTLRELDYVVKAASDTLECRIERILKDMSNTALIVLPEDEPTDVTSFLEQIEKLSISAASKLSQQSQQVECSVYELIDVLKHSLKADAGRTLEDSFACTHLDMKQKTRCQECLSCSCYNLMGQLCQKNTDSLIRCMKISLESLRHRLHVIDSRYQTTKSVQAHRVPLFRAEIQLAIPNIVLRPSLKDIQSAVNKAVNIILSVAKDIPLWKFAYLHYKQQQVEQALALELGDESKLTRMVALKPLDKQIIEHKDVNKVVIQLNTIILSLKTEALVLLKTFSEFSDIWNKDPEEKVKEFIDNKPTMAEFQSQIRYFSQLEMKIRELPNHCALQSVEVATESLKIALIQECRSRQRTFGLALNKRSATDVGEIYSFIENVSKRLSRPIHDLEDVREAMEALKEIRENEIKIDVAVGHIEESYSVLHKYNLLFQDENTERGDGLSYVWKNLNTQARQVEDLLLKVQPEMKTDLLRGVQKFQIDTAGFYKEYAEKGPSEDNIPPHEASNRLQIFQAKFDELWRKYLSLSGGEELFGLPITEYPELHKIKRELSLLQKLYSLYDTVTSSIERYNEMLWNGLNIEKINSELLDFQSKIRKLPKALKEWQAFQDLKKKIDDFTESCPLLEMMKNKAMLSRHWEKIAQVTGHHFDVDSENFTLKNVMDAPLLKHKEDIEDICISAVKEKDIEAKLKHIISEWSTYAFSFSQFKTRGELLLKGSDISEKIALVEDSLMMLGSLMSNRYNAPFKSTIQQWVQKLTNTAEIIENWITVQNLWIYLEAVFVGGDIAKQLPQEARRFQNIDKSWQRIMQRAHETSDIVQCCVGDETLAQLLPHLLEQLEICQKSLTGYLEKKRLIFPRFFFVSDPALLEILGQASDSHTIQAHLLSLFDNVNRVGFHEKNYDQILLFESQEGEQVNIIEPVLAQGNVEFWLGQLLNGIRKTIHTIIRQASMAINDSEFKMYDFQAMFPAQIGLLGIQIIWTRDAEKALNSTKTDKKAMHTTNQKFLELLNELIDMATHNLTRMERTKYETLITIHVHQKDIFDDLVRMNIKSPSDFEWQKQSRFYFLEDLDKCIIKITDVEFTYCNEYLGCTDRLVITPLTDRCYITLAQALGMSMGGAPAGPAGTGKTETTKDMGKCLGKYVVVFNCSDQMDYRGLGRIYKGLAQSGAWGCFDEFNRIELPVLSVAAQQIYIVLQCKKKKKLQFTFTDGDVVDMDREFGIFLTMNPGYAGRQELPENLKIQFRTVAMMVPDRSIIMRVKLASAGFRDNQVLSQKFYTLYKLCEEQLSKQVHYDFGLRNILSVLRTLGAVKRSNPQEPEKTVVMRVLRDMNLSKLVDEDEPLFMSLINDLFPGITLDKSGYPELQSAIQKQTEEAGLINHPPWLLKLIQLYETQRVRHGMMTLGPTGAGKTKCINILMKAMTDCGAPHKEMRMNPKAITASQMFGTLDVATNDWTDGIFSTLWRKTLKAKKGEHIWIVLDGPVDAIWIENLNSVLDDNKTLTLANGDRIPMSPNCKIIFEPHNIDNASPATVSRNGMIFMSSSVLDWKPILRAWLRTLPATYSNVLWNSFNAVFQDVMDFVFSAVTPKMSILECMYIKQAIDLLQGLLSGRDEKQLSEEHIARLFVFSVMWSAGALLEPDDKLKMELFLRKHSAVKELPAVNGEETMFEFGINACGQWEHWSKKVPEYIYPKDSVPEYTSILVPNIDSVRTDFLMHTIMRQGKAVLLIGEQGTAKTVTIKNYTSKYDPDVHLTKCLNFSSATLPHMFQRSIESYIGKRMGATHGPPAGKKMTVFIDDINMPLINEWGDQITNEIVRQLMEQKGFYSLEKPGEFTSVVDIQFVAAMIHPGGGRNDIPQRLKRQFTILNCTLPSTSSIDKIFQTIAEGYFCEQRHFPAEVCKLASALVSTSRKVWQMTKAKMLPTPAKFHYIFNLRDLSRIWQGILTVTSDVCQSISVLVALFQHECRRVIADRFISQSDKDWFEDMMRKIISEEHGQNLFGDKCTELYFVDFLRDVPEAAGDEPDDAELKAPKIYELIPSLDYLAERLQMFMQQYNETVRGSKMDLVFFKDAIIHLIKISRIIRTPQGNALLVGVGGSGKQSLTRLASYIAGYESFQITLTRTYATNNLLDDLKTLYLTAGQKGKGVVFIFTDNEVRDESFLEYMNNVLASGEVSNLFARDEIGEITQDLIPAMKKEYPRLSLTGENLYNYFLARVRNNLHVVLCFSPVGEKFRTRALKFPGLISGCTMDWFQHWPKDALVAVAQHFLASYHIECTDEVKQSVVNTMGTIQDIVAEKCDEYFERYRRRTFVTPKSYLSFIGGYKAIYKEKFASLGSLSERMRTGLAKLMEAEVSVNLLSKELAMKEKDLALASTKADEVLLEVTMKAHAAEKVKMQVQMVKDKAQAIVDDIAIDKSAAEEKLEAARPALEEAKAALQTIKPSDIATVRKLGKPPHLIMRIMDCVLLLFQRKVDSVTLDHDRPGVKPSWTEAQKLMNNSGFLSMLLTFQKDSITEETVELLEPYLDMEDYNLENAKKVCGNVAGLCSWTQAMAYFYGINKEVLPLKANLALQEGRLSAAQMELNSAQNQLDEKQKELDEVQAMYDAAMKEKQALLDDAEACRRKMNNATALIEGLGGEKLRWTASSKNFQNQIINLVGNVLLATGFLSYSGPFNQEYRNLLLQMWKKEMDNSKIPYSKNLNLTGMLVDNATVGEWNLQGLPNDDLSIQNGIIVTKASRYPLLIDPQGQGKSWIKNKEKNNGLQVTAMNHKFFRSHIEDCLSLGRPLLIEDIGEELDPALDNILEKNFIKSGSAHKVKVGDKEVDLAKGFTLYMTTKVANPVYTPEISARTTVIDFTVTMKGLEDQLLGRVILTEKQELEAERIKLMEQVTYHKRKMQELEDNLLCRLTSTEGSLVEDESLIEVLRITKTTAEEVSEKLNTAMETEVKINTAREEYRPVAGRGSILYFLIVEMSMINVMYQTSLGQFLGVFDLSVERSQKSQIAAKRVVYIIEHLTYEVFKYTVRGLYENHRFLFTLLLALKIDLQAKKISHNEFETLIKGGASLDMNSVEPKPKKWILDTTWLNLVQLSSLYPFNQLLVQIVKNEKSWKAWFDEEAPEKSVIPDGYDSLLDQFHKLLLVRSWCPDHTVAQARHYIAESLGEKYAEGFILEMEAMWRESGCRTPLTCLLSVGSDPTENIERLAKSKNIPCRAISMGQGQEVHARHLLNQCMQDGGWLLLQNCHLGLEFLHELMDTITTKESMSEDFRTWITTEAHPEFPINLLQSSIKFTNESPQGVKAGLKRTYSAITQDLLGVSKMPQWKPLLYAVAFLHTTVQERRKFGPLGWNIPYEFNQADFAASVQFVQNHLNDVGIKHGVNWSCVRYMLGEVQYGGRVTDDLDKALLNTYARVWFGEHMFSEKFCFYKGYVIPKGNTVEDYLQHIEQLPVIDTPEVFGLHPNADITYQTNLANETFSTIVSIQPKDSSTRGGETREAVVQRLADEMLEKLPPDYNPHEVKAQLQKMGAFQPINIFLRQEIDRMQLVISRVRATLTDLKLAIDGTMIMSEELQDALDNIYDARIPKLWFRISWESTTLGFWFTELLERNQQFSSWLQDGRPNQFWMTGFFNPQGFLTAMRQETTRMNLAKGWELDSVVLCSEVTKMMKEDVVSPPPADIGGVYIHGLFLEGAGWDRRNSKLVESAPKVLFTSLPVVHVYAVSTTALNDPRKQHGNVYSCPVYKKPRRTDLTYIFSLYLKTVQNPDHWTLRGVALLCSSK